MKLINLLPPEQSVHILTVGSGLAMARPSHGSCKESCSSYQLQSGSISCRAVPPAPLQNPYSSSSRPNARWV